MVRVRVIIRVSVRIRFRSFVMPPAQGLNDSNLGSKGLWGQMIWPKIATEVGRMLDRDRKIGTEVEYW